MSVFISYSWDSDEHKEWVKELAARLRADGVDVTLDSWSVVPGDQLPAFMEAAIRENEFVVIVCTQKYKERSDARKGGVGYEGDIMTAEVFSARNNRKFIPVLRGNSWENSAPSWLAGKYYVDLSGDPYSDSNYLDLARTLLKMREEAPSIGSPLSTIPEKLAKNRKSGTTLVLEDMNLEDIKITRVIIEEVTEPKNDGTRGSALYAIPFELSKNPTIEWRQLFVHNWNSPPRFTTMHRPGIARISGSVIILDGTTIEEVEKYHRDTLQLAVDETNKQYREYREQADREEARRIADREQHERNVEEVGQRINFE